MTNLPIVYNTSGATLYYDVQFSKADGTGTNPTVVSLTVTDPDGNVNVYNWSGGSGNDPNNIVSDGSGAFHIELQVFSSDAPSGVWNAVWQGQGGLIQYGTQVFIQATRVMPVAEVAVGLQNGYCTMDELKSRVGIALDDTKDDYEIQLVVQTVTDWITTYCGRHFYQISEVRTFRPEGVWSLVIDDLVTINQLSLDYDGDGTYEVDWTEDQEYQCLRYQQQYNLRDLGTPRPRNFIQVISSGPPSVQGGGWLPWVWPFTRQDRVKIDAVWGWDSVPANVTQAALYIAAEMFRAKDSPFGVSGIADLGIIKIQASPWVVELLRAYKNPTKTVGV